MPMTQIEGERASGAYDPFEAATSTSSSRSIVEFRLRNLLNFTPVAIDKRLAPEYGGVVVYIQNPDGHVVPV